jgi:hypothetical protein
MTDERDKQKKVENAMRLKESSELDVLFQQKIRLFKFISLLFLVSNILFLIVAVVTVASGNPTGLLVSIFCAAVINSAVFQMLHVPARYLNAIPAVLKLRGDMLEA